MSEITKGKPGHHSEKQKCAVKIKKVYTIDWRKRDSNPQPLSLQTNTQPFSQAGQMIELCCE